MVNIYSPSGKEKQITEFLNQYLCKYKLPVNLSEVSEGRHNIEVLFNDKKLEVAFIGHIDTVPAYDIEQYEFVINNDTVRGLGTADMKGGCAAMIEGFIAAAEAGIKPEKAGLFLVIGEEENGDGIKELIRSRRFPWAIVAEPTDLYPCFTHFGYLEMLVRAFGTRRHASMAGREYNAIFSMLKMLKQVAEFVEKEKPEIIMNIRDLHSSEAGFAVPGSCEAWIDFHMPPDIDPEKLANELRSKCRASLNKSDATNYNIEFPTLSKGYSLYKNNPISKMLKNIYEQNGMTFETASFKSHSDSNFLKQAGCNPIILGPGKLTKAHTRNESIRFSSVTAAAHLYKDILQKLEKY